MAKRGNGEGSIQHNLNRNRWEARVTVATKENGEPIRRMVTGRTRAEVVKAAAALNNSTEGGMTPAQRTLTVGTYLKEWLDEVLPGSIAESTLAQYEDVVRLYIVPYLGRKRLGSLTPRDVTSMVRALEVDGKARNTQRLARSVLRRSLRNAEAEGLISRNVAQLSDAVKVPQAEGRSLTVEQAKKFLTHLEGHPLEAAYAVALALGLRRGELLGLAWGDIDLTGKPAKLTVSRSLKRIPRKGLQLDEPKTRGSRRTVHLPAPVVKVLRDHRRRQRAERLALGPAWPKLPMGADLVFRSPLGTPMDPDNFRQATYKITEEAGIGKWSPHELRHSAASLLIAQNVPMKLVSELLGHSSIRITADIYGHLFDEAGAVASDAMTAALWGAS